MQKNNPTTTISSVNDTAVMAGVQSPQPTSAQNIARTRGEDVALARAVAAGDADQIEYFCTMFANDIARYARRFASRLENEELEDIAQTVLVTGITNIETYRGDSSLKTWILRIAHHKLVDAVRHLEVQERRETVFTSMPEGWEPEWPEQPEDILIEDEEKRRISGALNQLPERERMILTMRYLHDMDTQQISQVINISHRLTQKLLTQGRKRIRSLLGFAFEA